MDELLQQFGTYKKPPQPPQPDWLTAEQLASGVKPSANPPEDAPSEPASPPDKPPESEPSHLTEEFPTHYPGASADRPQSQPPPAVPLNQQEEARQREAERQQQAQQQELARQQEAARQREQARQLEQYQQRALARPPRRRPKEPLRYKVFRFKQGIRQRARRTARAHWFRFGLLAVLGAYALYGLPTVQALAGIDASTWHPWLVQAFTLPYIQSGVGFPALIALLFFTTRFGLLDWLGGFRWFVVLSILGWVYRVELIGPLF